MIRKLICITITSALYCGMFSTAFAASGGEVVTNDPTKHFDVKGKMPSKFTIELQNGLRKSLPFDDKRDFEEAKKGVIAAPDYKQMATKLEVIASQEKNYV